MPKRPTSVPNARRRLRQGHRGASIRACRARATAAIGALRRVLAGGARWSAGQWPAGRRPVGWVPCWHRGNGGRVPPGAADRGRGDGRGVPRHRREAGADGRAEGRRAGAGRRRGFRERFIRESRAAAAVDHPHIIPVYGAGEAGVILYLAMRYVPGGDLGSVMRREGPLPAERAAFLLSPVASALDGAHAAGLVHRDVKPANVLVDISPGRPDHPYLSDFGLAKGAASRAGLTGTGSSSARSTTPLPSRSRAGGRTSRRTSTRWLFE